jgi:hypothetical protein
MNKPNNYENTQAGGDFVPVELGGHYAVIKNVSEKETKNGDPMIVVSIDFDKKDAQAGYFTDQFKKDVRPDKKYPNQATNYITTEYGGACTKGFKSFMKAYADSNNIKEDAIKWGSDFTAQFKNKKIGVVFGNVEETYNGETKMRRKIRWFCDYNKVADQRVPDDKYEKQSGGQTQNANDFVNVPEGSEDEIPFD